MNQQCKVCGEPAAGFHFGAFTCEGCKSFFGRTYNNLSSISECKNNGCCVINKKNRTSCKACRLRKCLMVGMSKSGSRYGRRSNWFKIHCLLQEQQQQSQHHQQHPQQPNKNNNIFFPPNGMFPQEAFYSNGHRHPGRKHEDSSSEDSATSSPHPQTSPAFFPNPSMFLPGRYPPEIAATRKRKHGNDSSSEDSTHSSSQNNLSSPHPQTPPMFFPNPALFLPSRYPPDPLQHHKRFEVDNSSEDSRASSRNNNKLPLGFYSNPNLFLPSRVIPTPEKLLNGSKKLTVETSSDVSSDSDFSHPLSATPTSPLEEYHRKLSATVMLASSTHLFASKPSRNSVTKPGLTPSSRHFAGESCPGSARTGGDLLMVSPAIGGVPVEQDQPIDLSIRPNQSESSVKREDDNDEDDGEEEEVRSCKDGVLDLTSKRTVTT